MIDVLREPRQDVVFVDRSEQVHFLERSQRVRSPLAPAVAGCVAWAVLLSVSWPGFSLSIIIEPPTGPAGKAGLSQAAFAFSFKYRKTVRIETFNA